MGVRFMCVLCAVKSIPPHFVVDAKKIVTGAHTLLGGKLFIKHNN